MTCDRDGLPWVKIFGGEILIGGGTKQVYVADVDGVALVVTVGYDSSEMTTTGLDEIDAILASCASGADVRAFDGQVGLDEGDAAADIDADRVRHDGLVGEQHASEPSTIRARSSRPGSVP